MKAFHFGPEPLYSAADFRRWLVASLLLHVCTALMLVFVPSTWLSPRRPAPVFVELVAALPEPASAASKPQSQSAPSKPEPVAVVEPPRQVIDEALVIPKEPIPVPKPKPEVVEPKPEPVPEPKPVAKPEPKPEPKAEPKAEPKPKTAPLTKEQILAQLRSKLGSVTPEASESAGAAGPRGTQRVDPLLAAWHTEVRDLMYANWVGARPFKHKSGLEVQFVLDLDASGRVRSVRLTRTSGLRVLDESAERTIHKVLPDLPPAPDGLRTVNVTFDPREV